MGRRLRLQQQEKEWEKVQQRQQLARSPVAPHSASAQMFKHCVPHTYTHTYTQSVCVCVCVCLLWLSWGKANRKRSKTNSKNQTKPMAYTHCTTPVTTYTALHSTRCTAHVTSPTALFAHCMREGAFCLKFVFEWKTFVKINYEFVRSIVFR